jgi:glyoxylase-like metal-dependent hydrolase (beta-lactamase superfamily II)
VAPIDRIVTHGTFELDGGSWEVDNNIWIVGDDVLLHPGDDVLWRMTHPDKDFRAVSDGDTLTVAGTQLRALHTPGHSPGSVCWYAPELARGH